MEMPSWSLESSAVSAELKRFVAEKCAQVRAERRAPEHGMVPECQWLFTAAEKGDWSEVFKSLAAMHQAMREGRKHPLSTGVVYPVEWAVVNEVGAALEAFATWEKYATAFARDIIASIPPGSIYFGGTDPGRFLVTALSTSHVNGDPFFTVAQNALADQRSYLRYLRGMYGSQIHIPTDEDVTQATNQYQEDARRRQKAGKRLPGECAEETGGRAESRGHVGVMVVNSALSKLMFEKTPDREFYVEKSFPLDWMYPHLSPQGLILKINRQQLSELSSEVVQRDHEFWIHYVGPMIGDWLKRETSLDEVVTFVRKVHVRRDLTGYSVDRQFLQSDSAQKAFSKLRSSIGGVYSWRAQRANGSVEKSLMLREAEFAFRQAFALCPSSPEAVYRYVNVLVGQQRLDEAILMIEAAVKLEELASADSAASTHVQEDSSPTATVESQTNPSKLLTPLGSLLEHLRRMKKK